MTNIVVSGANGFIGTALVSVLEAFGYRVFPLVRPSSKAQPRNPFIAWDPEKKEIDLAGLEGKTAVVHLGGKSLMSGLWTSSLKRELHRSRVEATTFLAQSLASLKEPPKVLVCASAIGFYGDRGDEALDEESSIGTGFLAELVRDWEASTSSASEAGIRVINARFGLVLSRNGGALAKMLTPFKLGLGGKIGDGAQFMSWISITDAVAAILHGIHCSKLSGPVNFVSPHPVRNIEFTRVLGACLRRPTILPLPAFVVGLAPGGMGQELLLSSARVVPRKLADSKFEFCHETLDDSLFKLLFTS